MSWVTAAKRVAGAVLTVSVAGLAFTAGQEGTRLPAYPDPVLGWAAPTICNGHTGPDVHRGMVATPAICKRLLSKDAQKAADAVIRCSGGYPFKQHELDALADFTLNLGASRYCSSTLSRYIRERNPDAAAQQFPRWRFAGDRDCKIAANNCRGVYKRRLDEQRLFLTGDYGK